MERTLLEGIIRTQLYQHERIHDERIVEREELVQTIANAIIAKQARLAEGLRSDAPKSDSTAQQ